MSTFVTQVSNIFIIFNRTYVYVLTEVSAIFILLNRTYVYLFDIILKGKHVQLFD